MPATITIEGNLAKPPTERTNSEGKTFTHARVITSDRHRTKTGTYLSGPAQGWDVYINHPSIGRNLTEVARALGNVRLVVTGTYTLRAWKTRTGEERLSHTIHADHVGISLLHNLKAITGTNTSADEDIDWDDDGTDPIPYDY